MGGSMREGSRCCTGLSPYDAPRLATVFNLSGSEVVVLLLLALIVLGPERLPEAVRSFGRVYGQLRRMGEGFQTEMRQALDEPMREIRDTAELARRAVIDAGVDDTPEVSTGETAAVPPHNPEASEPSSASQETPPVRDP